jgi:hypothetical protein
MFRLHMFRLTLALMAGLGMTGAVSAKAQLTLFTDRASFNAACPGLPVEDFEKADQLGGVDTAVDGPLDKFTDDGIFAPGDILDGLRLQERPARGPGGLGLAVTGDGFNGLHTRKVFTNFFGDTLDIDFYNDNVFCTGMDISSVEDASSIMVSVYGSGDLLLATTTLSAPNFGDGAFFGVLSDSLITRIDLASSSDQAEGVDNIAFGTPASVPEPSALALFGVSILGMLVYSGRRRSRAS